MPRSFVLLFLILYMISCNESKNTETFVNLYEPPPPGSIPPDTTAPDTSGNPNDTTITDPEQIFITDENGKMWNVTHAVNKYGFNPGRFQFGLGQYAIRPINNPVFLESGQAGYPDETNGMQIIGTTIGGESRAYPLSILGGYEIINDSFGDTHVAVGF